MKIIKLFFLFLLFASFNKSKQLDELLVLNSVGDSSYLFKKDTTETFYVFSIEPSCTGCKETLAKFLIKKSNLVIITNYYLYIEGRKVAQKYFSGVFTNAKQFYFLADKNQLLTNLNLSINQSPCLIWFSNKTKSYSIFNYYDIFEGTSLKKTFKNKIKK
ncbi:MAG: hypothetical protein IT243_03435 [Bacteroidia bacterium]|nr:hypothetical protein [Bacteroidia bacterium]